MSGCGCMPTWRLTGVLQMRMVVWAMTAYGRSLGCISHRPVLCCRQYPSVVPQDGPGWTIWVTDKMASLSTIPGDCHTSHHGHHRDAYWELGIGLLFSSVCGTLSIDITGITFLPTIMTLSSLIISIIKICKIFPILCFKLLYVLCITM